MGKRKDEQSIEEFLKKEGMTLEEFERLANHVDAMDDKNLVRLDSVAMDSDGEHVSLHEIIACPRSQNVEARRIKAELLAIAKTKKERDLIEYLSQGYSYREAAKEIKVSESTVVRMVKELRNKCLKLQENNKSLRPR